MGLARRSAAAPDLRTIDESSPVWAMVQAMARHWCVWGALCRTPPWDYSTCGSCQLPVILIYAMLSEVMQASKLSGCIGISGLSVQLAVQLLKGHIWGPQTGSLIPLVRVMRFFSRAALKLCSGCMMQPCSYFGRLTDG